jgi:NUMOD3 motif
MLGAPGGFHGPEKSRPPISQGRAPSLGANGRCPTNVAKVGFDGIKKRVKQGRIYEVLVNGKPVKLVGSTQLSLKERLRIGNYRKRFGSTVELRLIREVPIPAGYGEGDYNFRLKAAETFEICKRKTWVQDGGRNQMSPLVQALWEPATRSEMVRVSWTAERRERFSKSQKSNKHFQGHTHPENWKKAAAARQTGEHNSFAGKQHSPLTRKQMRLDRLGAKNSFWQKSHTQESKNAIGKANSLPLMEEHKNEIIRRYETEGQSMGMIAKWADTNSSTVHRYLHKWGIEIRSLSEAQQLKHKRIKKS